MTVAQSKFLPLEHYGQNCGQSYSLLPFRFTKLDSHSYVLTNVAGEYIVLPKQQLADFVQHKLDSGCELYNSLKSKHFLIDGASNVAIDLLSLKVRTKMDFIAEFTSLHIFVVTLRCDHSCPYCQVSRQSEDKAAFDMSVETANKALDFTFETPANNIKIEFQGGESLLNFELIKYIVVEAKRRNEVIAKNLAFVIATNLSPLNDEMLEFCSKHDVMFSTSLDGPKELHNQNRPRPGSDSYERAIEGINKIKSKMGPDSVSALMTTTKASLSVVTDIIDEYVRQGFRSIFLRPLSPYGFAIKTKSYDAYNSNEWFEFYKEGLNYIIDLNKNGLFFVEDYTALILQKMLTPFGTGYVDLQSPAGAGISAIVFNYDANVYASDESRMLAEMGMEEFNLGNLHKHNYQEIILSERLLTPLEDSVLESVPMCNDCAFQPYCGSDPVYHYATQGDYIGHKAFSGFCKKNMALFRYIIGLLEDDNDTRDILMSWVRV